MYAKIRGKRNKPFSSIKKKTVRVVEKGVSITLPAPVTEPSRTVSLATSIEEITPIRKRPWVEDKGKDKADFKSSSVFDDVGLALLRVHEFFSTEELRTFLGVPSDKIVGRHINKIVQVLYLCDFPLFFFLFFFFRH